MVVRWNTRKKNEGNLSRLDVVVGGRFIIRATSEKLLNKGDSSSSF